MICVELIRKVNLLTTGDLDQQSLLSLDPCHFREKANGAGS